MIVGIDEAGRGCLFGRVYAAAVSLPDDCNLPIKDSKKLSEKARGKLFIEIIKNSNAWGIGYAEASEIDTYNILQATMLAMNRAIYAIKSKIPDESIHLKIDGNYFHNYFNLPYETIVKGDDTESCIGAASILAKVSRDQYIYKLVKEIPMLQDVYQMGNHKGYGTLKHRQAINIYGLHDLHRKSYKLNFLKIVNKEDYSNEQDIIDQVTS